MKKKNTGTTTWSPGANGYTLNRNPQNSDPFQQGIVSYATLIISVTPRSPRTFTLFPYTTLFRSTYTESWRMSSSAPGFPLFGDTASLTRTVTAALVDNAQLDRMSTPPNTRHRTRSYAA